MNIYSQHIRWSESTVKELSKDRKWVKEHWKADNKIRWVRSLEYINVVKQPKVCISVVLVPGRLRETTAWRAFSKFYKLNY